MFASPVTLPVISPTNDVADNAPLLELNSKLDPLLGAKSPVAAVTKSGKQVVSEDSSATVKVLAFTLIGVPLLVCTAFPM